MWLFYEFHIGRDVVDSIFTSEVSRNLSSVSFLILVIYVFSFKNVVHVLIFSEQYFYWFSFFFSILLISAPIHYFLPSACFEFILFFFSLGFLGESWYYWNFLCSNVSIYCGKLLNTAFICISVLQCVCNYIVIQFIVFWFPLRQSLLTVEVRSLLFSFQMLEILLFFQLLSSGLILLWSEDTTVSSCPLNNTSLDCGGLFVYRFFSVCK